MAFLTDFADAAVILPMAFTVAAALGLSGWRRGALAWILSVGGTLIAMLGLKLVFHACGPAMGVAIESPSGHTAAATATYGGLLVLLGVPSAVAFVASAAVALLVGVSRVALGMHTPPEVVLGALVGLGGVVVMVRLVGATRRPVPRVALIAALLAVVVVFHGGHVHAEPAIHHLARLLDIWPFSVCRGIMAS
ncbi:MAG: phosphatase PAP2 family protein [Acetobacteraceae bacterium]|nr:phosphatase PAP2 family protein [Acetobacteraceae bacterium]